MAIERDPDDYRDGAILDQVPRERWAETRGLLRGGRGLELDLPQQNEDTYEREIAELRKRANRLADELHALAPAIDPPTIPEQDERALRSVCKVLEGMIEEAKKPTAANGWLGHRMAQRQPGAPVRCTVCLVSLERARGRCVGRPGQY